MDKKWYQKGLDWLLEKDNVGKKWYKKRIVWVSAIVVVVLIMLLNPEGGKDGSKNTGKYEIPNVFGVNYSSAIEVLEADGFEVKSIETDAKDILDKLSYKIDTLEKGSVFKVDDYIQNGIGNIQKNDNYSDYEQMFSNDKSIVIYYAKDTYSRNEKNNAESNNVISDDTDASSAEDKQTTSETTTKEPEKKETNNGGIRADFKSAMDSYEKFFDEYVAIMKKYANNPSDMSILSDYTKYMGKYTKMMDDFEKWESEDMNAAETAYYLEVQGRITKKLLEVAQ